MSDCTQHVSGVSKFRQEPNEFGWRPSARKTCQIHLFPISDVWFLVLRFPLECYLSVRLNGPGVNPLRAGMEGRSPGSVVSAVIKWLPVLDIWFRHVGLGDCFAVLVLWYHQFIAVLVLWFVNMSNGDPLRFLPVLWFIRSSGDQLCGSCSLVFHFQWWSTTAVLVLWFVSSNGEATEVLAGSLFHQVQWWSAVRFLFSG